MKSSVLVPYCPLPVDTGAKVEMWKHLDVLRGLGECNILSAATKPVGNGWSAENRHAIEARGFKVVLREEEYSGRSLAQWTGMLYAAVGKGLGLERLFGHSNPYHRYAFPAEWWLRHTGNADLAVVHYSYWAWLPCACPKVVALLDVWSDYMWEGPDREIEDLAMADLVTVISMDEELKLRQRGLQNTLWSPPAVAPVRLPDSSRIGLVGSPSSANREGLRWLRTASDRETVNVFGGLAGLAAGAGFEPVVGYSDPVEPYRRCGIILMTTTRGMGVQIKGIEALAAGRAIVSRRGAMRGIPAGDGAWIEVDTPGEMMAAARKLQAGKAFRAGRMAAARAYYDKHLDAGKHLEALKSALTGVADGKQG